MTLQVERLALGNIADLTTPSATQNGAYRLGQIIMVADSDTKVQAKYMYVKSHTTLTAFQPYVLSFGGTSGAEVVTAAPATLAAPGAQTCVPQVAFTSGYYGWVAIEGDIKALMTTETYVVGDFLRIINAGTYMKVDGTSGSTTFSVNTCAVCREAGSTAVARKIYLINKYAVIAAA